MPSSHIRGFHNKPMVLWVSSGCFIRSSSTSYHYPKGAGPNHLLYCACHILRLPFKLFSTKRFLGGKRLHDAIIPADEVDDFIILNARVFTSKVRRAIIRDVLNDENLPILEWQLLHSIARFGSCHLGFITRHTSIDPAHGSRAAAALEKKGLITRREDPENKRRKLISLTSAGKKTIERVWPRAYSLVRSVTDQLDPADFAHLKRLLNLLGTAADSLTIAPENPPNAPPNSKEARAKSAFNSHQTPK